MKRIIIPSLFCFIVLTNNGCKKESEENFLDSATPCLPAVVNTDGILIDSVFYTADNKISAITTHDISRPELNSRTRFVYWSNFINVYITDFSLGYWHERHQYYFKMKDSKIVKAIIYTEILPGQYALRTRTFNFNGSKLRSVSEGDSIVVKYDEGGNNIVQLTGSDPHLTCNYKHDNKINGYKNSLYYFYTYFDSYGFWCAYYNLNNEVTRKGRDMDDTIVTTFNVNNYPSSHSFFNFGSGTSNQKDVITYLCR